MEESSRESGMILIKEICADAELGIIRLDIWFGGRSVV